MKHHHSRFSGRRTGHHHHHQPSRSCSLAIRNFRFVLDETSALVNTKHGLAQLDEMIDVELFWKDVVCITSNERSVCPICLSLCQSPRVLKCSHVLCGPCSLRAIAYNEMSGDQQCPICFSPDVLQRSQLRYCFHQDSLNCDFVLVRTSAAAAGGFSSSGRFQAANPNFMLGVLDRHEEEIHACLEEFKKFRDEDGVLFANILLTELKEHRRMYLLKQDLMGKNTNNTNAGIARAAERWHGEENNQVVYYRREGDAVNDFLSPLMMDALIGMYGGVNNLPLRIRSKTLQIDPIVAPKLEGLRLPLNTVPYGASCRFFEIDLRRFPEYERLNKQIKERIRERDRKRVESFRRIRHQMEEQNKLEEKLARDRMKEREDQELLLLNFFGFKDKEEAKAHELQVFQSLESFQKSEESVGSFSTIVSHGGYFPALPTVSKPSVVLDAASAGGGVWNVSNNSNVNQPTREEESNSNGINNKTNNKKSKKKMLLYSNSSPQVL